MRAGVNNVNISLVMMLPDCNWILIRTGFKAVWLIREGVLC
jgi:hypothetical protein